MGGVQAGPEPGHWGDQDESRLSLLSRSSTPERSTDTVAKVVGLNWAFPKHATSKRPSASAREMASRQTPASRVTTSEMEPTPASPAPASLNGCAGLIFTRT